MFLLHRWLWTLIGDLFAFHIILVDKQTDSSLVEMDLLIMDNFYTNALLMYYYYFAVLVQLKCISLSA